MALWQIDFFVIPKGDFDPGHKLEMSDEDGFDDAVFWEPKNVAPDFFESIGVFLPRAKSWSNHLILYGNENSNRFSIVEKNNLVESVSFRIDFTSNYEEILRALIDFFILNGLIVLDETLRVLPLNFEIIKGLIDDSQQVVKYKALSKK